MSQAETFYEQDMLIQPKKTLAAGSDEDQFDSLEVFSQPFTYGGFEWTLCLRPQPLLIPIPASSSSWAAPIQKVLQQHRINNLGGQDLDQLGLSVLLLRRACQNNNNAINAR